MANYYDEQFQWYHPNGTPPTTAQPEPQPQPQATDPYAGQSHQQMAQQQFGWNGWNADNIWNSDSVIDQARTFQERGGATAGLRDYLSTERDAFLNPLMQQYRQLGAQQNFAVNEDDAGVWADQNFRQWVQSGQTPQGQPNTASSMTTQQPANPNVTQFATQQMETQATQDSSRNQNLWQALMDRATQGLNLTRTDPVIRTQADAYAAQEERAKRNYLADLAEREGPLANLRGEQRMASERMGQRVGGFEAQLLGRELTARRQEIAESLEGLRGLLTADQQINLQRQLGLLDQIIKQQNVDYQNRSLDVDWQRALMQNDQFLRQLGLNEWDRSNYWDAIRSGVIS